MLAIRGAVRAMGPGALSESGLRDHVFPLFSRVMAADRAAGRVYLANHSLGRPLDAMGEDVAEALDHWYRDLDGAWVAWMGEREAYRARIARLIGCARADAVVPKTAAGQGLRAVLNAVAGACPGVVATRAEFDSIDTILKAYAHKGRARVRWVETDAEGLIRAERVIEAIEPGTSLVVVSSVCFVTGQVVEGLEGIVRAAHGAGALVLVDAYHHAGVMPVGFDALGADFMIGGNYKYTRGGPGACWLAVHPRHLHGAGVPGEGGLFTLDTGWFAKEAPFAYDRGETPRLAGGGDAWLESTPPVLTFYQARSGLEFTLAVGVERLRAYSLGQQAALAAALRGRGVGVREIEPRGAYLLVPVADGPGAVEALGRRGVVVDARPCPTGRGWLVRLCPDVLTTGEEIERASGLIAPALRAVGPMNEPRTK